MIQAMAKMLKMKVFRVSEVSRWPTMTFLAFREILTHSYTITSRDNGRNPPKCGFYSNFAEIAQIRVRYGAFTKGLQRDPFGVTREISVVLFSSAIQYF